MVERCVMQRGGVQGVIERDKSEQLQLHPLPEVFESLLGSQADAPATSEACAPPEGAPADAAPAPEPSPPAQEPAPSPSASPSPQLEDAQDTGEAGPGGPSSPEGSSPDRRSPDVPIEDFSFTFLGAVFRWGGLHEHATGVPPRTTQMQGLSARAHAQASPPTPRRAVCCVHMVAVPCRSRDLERAVGVLCHIDKRHALLDFVLRPCGSGLAVDMPELVALLRPGIAEVVQQVMLLPRDFQKEFAACHLWQHVARENASEAYEVRYAPRNTPDLTAQLTRRVGAARCRRPATSALACGMHVTSRQLLNSSDSQQWSAHVCDSVH